MASLKLQNLQVSLGFHSISKYNTINYFVKIEWDDQPLLNPSIVDQADDAGVFLFTLSLEEDEDLLLSFFEKLLRKKEDMNLYNQIEPDVKILAHTWKGKLPYLRHKYGKTINVGNGMEPFRTGIKKLAERHGESLELVFKLPHHYFVNGQPARNNWMYNQYITLPVITNFSALQKLYAELQEEFLRFQQQYPVRNLVNAEYYEAFS